MPRHTKSNIRKKKHTKSKRITGLIRLHPKGFGFVRPDDDSYKEVFIPKRKTLGAIDGDFVQVEIIPGPHPPKGPEGSVKKVLKRGRSHIAATVCSFFSKQQIPYAYSPLLGEKSLIRLNSQGKKLQWGDRVLIEIQDWGGKQREPSGFPQKVFGSIKDPQSDLEATLLEHELEASFPEEVIKQAKSYGTRVTSQEIKNRMDFRDQECFTIDPTTAKDFDDALTLKKDSKGVYHLGVHIADVSHYVRPNTPLDQEARSRCNSTYLPGFVIPMLPHELSSHLCSLKPMVNRLTVSVLVKIDPKGKLLDYSIVRSVIRSKKRFTYEEAKQVLDGTISSPHEKTLRLMVELCHLLKKQRAERGSIEFALPDTQLMLDKNGLPKEMQIVEYDITHQLVEEFMLKANEIVATHLSHLEKPLTYRIHGLPSDDHIKDFCHLATLLGYPLEFPVENERLQKFFDEVRETNLGRFFATAFIRCMKLACYSTDNIGHYGLGLEHYTHFTSPIRRYIDLTVHRALMDEYEEDEDLEGVAQLCSEKERLSAKAEQQMLKLKKLRFLKDLSSHKRNFEGLITGIKSEGVTFEVQECLIEGFLPLEAFGRAYRFNEEKKELYSKKTKFLIGDRLPVFPEEIDLITLNILWNTRL